MSEQAPKGGVTVAGVFYKGGQFLPANNEPKHGKYNSNSKKSKGAKKVEYAPYKWDYAPDGMIATWSKCATGVFTTTNKDNKLVWCASEQTEKYYQITPEYKAEVMAYAEKWNNGEYWIEA